MVRIDLSGGTDVGDEKTSRFWRRTWGIFVVVTFPIWFPGTVIGGVLATMATEEEAAERKKLARNCRGDQ